MTRQAIIDRTIEVINQLPENKAEEISEFADFFIKRYEENKFMEELQSSMMNSKAFDFLHHEQDMYTEADVKEKYCG